MVMIVGALVALGVGAWWLRGGWVVAVLMTLGYFGVGGLLALDGHVGSFVAVLAFVWTPFIVWGLLGRQPRPIVGPVRAMVGLERR